MASGSFDSATGSNLEIGCEWTSTANNASNTSSVRVRVYLKHYDIYCAALSGSYVSVGDVTEYFTAAMNSSDTGLQKTYIADKTFTVSHSQDGTKSVRISVGWVFNGTYNGHYISTLEASRTVSLDNIPRASSFTLPQTITLTSPFTANITAASSSYKHRMILRVGNYTFSDSQRTGTSFSLTPPQILASGMTSSKRAQGTVTLETYSGQTKIGETVKSVYFAVPETEQFMPDFTLSFTPEYFSSYLETEEILASGEAKGTVAVTGASAKYGASVSSCQISFGATKRSGYSMTVNPLEAGEFTYSAVVTDSRGIKRTRSGSVTVLPYHAPYAENVSAVRCLQDGTADDAGTYLSVYADTSFSSLSGANGVTAEVVVKSRNGVSTVGTWSLTPGVRKIIGASLSPTLSYICFVNVGDTVGESGSHRTVIPTSRVDIHMKNGKIRFGGYAERDGFECDYPAYFSGGLYVGDDIMADHVVSCGTSGIWSWRKWASGISECFGTTESRNYTFPLSYGGLYQSTENYNEGRNSVAYPSGLFISPPTVSATPSRVNGAVLIAPRTAGSASASPDYYIIYCSAPSGGVSCSLHLSCRGRWK